ncbi:hypothetical protein DACRYDRAFT_52897 [Dacryopinax primogenitus]|uniref:MFS general substrate transporter n=1 Tax=Dacryopinax primogenitus (strain DJM 731) TaxID=1858805 RepID=M5GC48_DACPD|nr:uncharacterized protein DACRYDRAFT_52897 [Dacryopinax primogenitus]EJU01608.1 hypothetical protein DACRYDRAFT_52897 [Dacryopinax primogenitus]
MVAAGLPSTIEEVEGHRRWSGYASVRGPRWARMSLLTVCLLGLQMTWSIEMSYAFPYLLTMGVSKALMSLVFVAGPLSGLVVQPVIGVFADRSKSRWGRRRPFMLAGCMISIGSLLLLGFTRNFVSILVDASTQLGQSVTVIFATVSIYFLDFSINAVQAMDRALLVDTLPASEQELGNAWAARLMGLGGVLGFFMGYMDLVAWFPFLGRTQLQVLVVIGSIILLGTHILTAVCVTEKVLVDDTDDGSRAGLFRNMGDIWRNIQTLPPRIRRICIIQFFNWISWFPILFYSSEWVGEIYTRTQVTKGRSPDDPEILSEAMRIGSEALFWQAVVVLITMILLPALLVYAEDAFASRTAMSERPATWPSSWLPIRVLRVITLPYLWAICHLLFAVMMFLTFITHSVWEASCILAVLGIPYAVTSWAPFSLLGEAIQAEVEAVVGEEVFALQDREMPGAVGSSAERTALISSTDEDEGIDLPQMNMHSGKPDQELPSTGALDIGTEVAHVERPRKSNHLSEKAGIMLVGCYLTSQGIHNIFVVIPQFLVNGLSAIVFALLASHQAALHDRTEDALNVRTNDTVTIVPVTPTAQDVDSIGVILRCVSLP